MFESLALSGGGVRGGLLVGGLSALETLRGNLTFPKGIYGCSIGSILATAIAFNLSASTIRSIFEDDFQLSRAIPPIRLSNIMEFQKTKGMFSMTMLRDLLVVTFRKHGVELEGKYIKDTPQKLFILTSNLTTRRSTFLTENVPLIEAILCSCCLPFIFHPQVLFQNVYVDGGVFTRNIHTIVPENCLVLYIDRSSNPMFPEDIETMSLNDMFTHVYFVGEQKQWPNNVAVFHNNTIQILQELTPENKKFMYETGHSIMTRFWTKRHS